MKTLLIATTALAFGAVAAIAAQAPDVPPSWAYGFTTPPPATPPPPPAAPAAAPQPDNTNKLNLPGSNESFTRAQIGNRFGPADWFPDDHPQMPNIVAHGKDAAQPPVFACGLCHYPTGMGRPENANVTGLSYEYIVQQLTDFKNGARKSSDPRKGNTNLMAGFAKNMTDDEIKEAAKYFSSIAFKPWVKVVESETVPKTRPQAGLFLTISGDNAGTEPIGDRIIETPVSVEQTEIPAQSAFGLHRLCASGQRQEGREPGDDG